MPRAHSQSGAPRRALIGAVLAATVLGLLPARLLRWIDWFGQLTVTVIAPVSHPAAAVSRWLRPAGPAPPDGALVARLEKERQHFYMLYLREMNENARLRGLVKDLQGGVALNPDLPVRQITAPVVGVPSDLSSALLRVRAGKRDGVELNTVAVAGGQQLLGRVVSVSARACLVQPITSSSFGPEIIARIMDEGEGTGLTCSLSPAGDGTLTGPVEHVIGADGAPIPPVAGRTVRLDDPDAWPASAQMFVVGVVERVEKSPAQPLRSIVVVRPTVRLERVSEVVLRVTLATGEEAGGSP